MLQRGYEFECKDDKINDKNIPFSVFHTPLAYPFHALMKTL